MRVSHVFLLFDGLLIASALFLSDRNDSTAASVFVFSGALVLWQIFLFSSVLSPMRMLRIEHKFRKPHVVQTGLQLCVYLYWGLYWREPASYAFFIGVQIICAYLFDMLLSLSRRGVWYAGFGPVPIVLSINLFIWFKEDYFYLQLLMVALTYFAKEFLTWNRDGRTIHIFNPSAFSLTIAAIALMCTGSIDKFTTGVDIIESFELSPNFYEVIFLLGLVVQLLFATAPLTFGAVVSNYSLFYLVSWILGGQVGYVPIDRSVFLAMTLLVTDPATSPKSVKGKFLFGVTYGATILASTITLKYFQQPDYFNKILFIPMLNLLNPVFERLATWTQFSSDTKRSHVTKWKRDILWTLLYACLFIGIVDSLKRTRELPLWRPWLKPVSMPSPEMNELLIKMTYCRAVLPDVRKPFSFRSEIAQYPEVKEICEGDLSKEMLDRVFGPEVSP